MYTTRSENYRQQRSCSKVIFSQASVILSMGKSAKHLSPGRHPPEAHIPWKHPRKYTPPPPPEAHPPPNGHCSGRYASYWNAFVFDLSFVDITTYKEGYISFTNLFSSDTTDIYVFILDSNSV